MADDMMEQKPPESQDVPKTVEPQEEDASTFKPIQIPAKDESEYQIKLDKVSSDMAALFGDYSTWRKPYEDLWNRVYKLFFNIQDVLKTPTRAKIFVPIVFQIIEAAVPKIINVLFGQEEYFDVEAISKKNESLASVIKVLLEYQLQQADVFSKFLDFIKQLCLYGTSYFKVYWKVTRKWVYERTPIRQDVSIMGFSLGIQKIVGWKEEKVYKTVERRPELEVLDVLDVFPEPDAATEKEASGVFLRSWIDIDDLRNMSKGRFPVYANTEGQEVEGGDTQYMTSRSARVAARGASNSSTVQKKKVELLEFWGEYDLDGDGIKEEVQIVIAQRRTVVRALSNPFHHQKKPLIKSNLFPVPLEWFGIGLVEPVIPLIHELNTLRRQRLDNVNMIVNRMWKVLNYADIDLDTLVSSPNGIILTDDMAAIEPLETPNVTTDAYNEAAIVQSDIEQTTAPKTIQGTQQTGSLGRTARGAQLLITQALEKFGTAVRLVEETALKRILRMFHQLNLQFIDDDETLQDTGFYGHLFDREVTPEMIRAEVNFKVIGISDMIGKEGKINQIVSFMGVFGKVLSLETVRTLAQKVWTLMGFNKEDISLQGEQMQPYGTPEGGPEQALVNQVMNQPGGTGTPAVPNAERGA